jgi:hypothetical protein
MDTALKAYLARWQAVEEIERQELQTATLDLRWQQLNSVIGMAIGLGIYQPVEDEIEVFQRWAELKENTTSQRPAV